MKYACTVCGYIYDDAEHEQPFADLPEDWKCPLCGAPKALFEPIKEAAPVTEEPAPAPQAAVPQENAAEEELVALQAGELSILFSNLARGCEKQYQEEARACFEEVAAYFEKRVPQADHAEVSRLAELIQQDLDADYKALRARAEAAGDRGALRIVTWGEKVTRMAKSLVDRYQANGDAFLKDTNLYICTVCGFLYAGDSAPALCPVCKVPGWKFEKIDGRAKK